MGKIITFILVGKKDDQLEKELIDMDSIIEYGNAIILRGTTKFRLLYENMKDDFKFRIIVHYGLKEDAKSVGKKIAIALKDYNFPLEYFTRETSIFTEENRISTMYSPTDTKNDCKLMMYNFDEMNTEDFINQLPIRCKKEILKSTATTVQAKNKPKIFIGCSVKGIPIARALRESLKHDAIVHLWDDNGFFVANGVVLHELEKIVEGHDYGIFIFRPDDTIYNIQRGNGIEEIPRDNVIFEYGMFMGKHTKKKVWFLIPDPKGEFKLMTDLLGIIPLTYKKDFIDLAENESDAQKKKQYFSDAVSGACDSIKTDISI